jgi:hypothetical protein
MKKFLLTLVVMAAFFAGKAQTISAADSLQQYTGKYKFPDGSVVTEVTITLSDSTLTITSAIGSAPLQKRQTDEFEIVGYGGTATFKRNAEGKVNGVVILVGDVNIDGTKTDGLVIKEEHPYR